MLLINPNYAWKIESNKEGLLNKSYCNGASFTLLLRTQIMGSKRIKILLLFLLPFVLNLGDFEFVNLNWGGFFRGLLCGVCVCVCVCVGGERGVKLLSV